jgi:G:T-mismatch repair DNA endonuclease (very short patch repair protein)
MNERDEKGRFLKGHTCVEGSEKGWFKKGQPSLRLGMKNSIEQTLKNAKIMRQRWKEGRFGESRNKKISNALKEQHKLGLRNEVYTKIGRKGRKISQETKSKMRLAKLGKPSNVKGMKFPKELYPDIGLRKTRKNIIFPFKDTTIEIKIQNFLKQLGIEFYTHQYIKEIQHSYQCDIMISVQDRIKQKTIIECDGDAFHFNPKRYNENSRIFRDGTSAKEQWELDSNRTRELIEKGWRVIRLWGSEIKVMNLSDFEIKLKENY